MDANLPESFETLEGTSYPRRGTAKRQIGGGLLGGSEDLMVSEKGTRREGKNAARGAT